MIASLFQLTTSRRGRRFVRLPDSSCRCFNSRPHEEVDLAIAQCIHDLLPFQLTTSRRGRLLISHSRVYLLLSQLTTSRRGRHRFFKNVLLFFSFNSRPHEEVDKILLKIVQPCLRFNSRPHEEVDLFNDDFSFSIFRFNSRPHEEVDALCITLAECAYCFNSRPHEEVDAEGLERRRSAYVSTHDLTKRSTRVWGVHRPIGAFQLTTSRRGRQGKRASSVRIRKSFNSRPHEEVDGINQGFRAIGGVSTHDLTKRSTTYRKLYNSPMFVFQLTTSRRGRPRNYTLRY